LKKRDGKDDIVSCLTQPKIEKQSRNPKGMKDIRDPVHGYVKLDSVALELSGTAQVQRLRWIRQLGLASLVYPGACHSRFEHSLGCCHLSRLLSIHLGLDERQRMLVMAGALLHDIGHGPFSHASESVLGSYLHKKHENIIDRLRSPEIGSILDSYGISSREVQQTITGQTEIGKIVSGEIDTDRMDYLIRDAHYTGVAYGVADHLRLMEKMRMIQGRLVVEAGGVQAAESLLVSRLLMHPTVYYHHVCRIAEAMLGCAIRHMIEQSIEDASGIGRMDDFQLFARMSEVGGYPSLIADRLKARRLYKRAIYVGREFIDPLLISGSDRRIAEEIAGMAGIEHELVLIDNPPPSDVAEGSFPVYANGAMRELREVSPLAATLEQAHKATWRFGVYTPKEHRDKVRRAAEKCLNVRKGAVQHTFDDMIL
jgi:HD superfamily phosphohydrolase